MVSFFFTPIYMFILVFIVSFGTKKGTLPAYSSAWTPLYSLSIPLLVNRLGLRGGKLMGARRTHTYRFQHTALTSRPTVYILALFSCFFFFSGDALLLATLNYNSLADLIPSAFFSFTKSHIIFMTDSSNAFLGSTTLFLILFFTTTAFTFLMNLRYRFVYLYNRRSATLEIVAPLIILLALILV